MAAVAALAVGIGGTSGAFGVVRSVLLRPLPFSGPHELVRLEPRLEREPTTIQEASYPEFLEWRDAAGGFASMAAYASGSGGMALTLDEGAVQLGARLVTADLLKTLGAEPLLGRIFTEESDGRGSAPVVVLGEGPWRSHFGGDPGVVGRTVELGGSAYTVVGVLPREFEYPRRAEAWVPVETTIDPGLLDDPGVGFLNPVARLEPDVGAAAAVASLNAAVDATTDAAGPDANRVRIVAVPLREQLLGDVRRPLLLLLAGGGVLLLVACLNVANLQVVRTLERREELAVRSALGASGRRLAAETLVGSAIVAVAGGALGLLAARWLAPVLVAASPAALYRGDTVTVDVFGGAATVGLAALATLLSGVLPAARAAGGEASGALRTRGGAGPGGGAGGDRMLRGVLAGQVALVTLLLVGGGLLARSWGELVRVDTGYAREGVLTVDVSLTGSGSEGEESAHRFYDRAVERIRTIPGVAAAGAILLRPLEGPVGFDYPFHIAGRDPGEAARYPLLNYEAVTPGYFDAAGLELLRGRSFGEEDRDDAPPVAVVSETVARRFWPRGGAVGARFRWGPPDAGDPGPWVTVVGVVEGARYRTLEAPSLDVYVPHRQSPWAPGYLVVRTAGDAGALVPAIRREVAAIDPDARLTRVATTGELVSDALARPRFVTVLLLLFAGAATLLGAFGTYGVVAYAAASRHREVGIRLALGATPASVSRRFLARGARTAAVGVAVGLGAGVAAGRLVASLLYRVSPADPVVLLGVPATVAAMALLASWLPARRAAAVDPVRSLRAR